MHHNDFLNELSSLNIVYLKQKKASKILNDLDAIKRWFKKKQKLHIFKSGDDISKINEGGLKVIVLGLQYFPENTDMQKLKNAGIHIITLTENQKELNQKEKDIIYFCAKGNIIIDFLNPEDKVAENTLKYIKSLREREKVRVEVIASNIKLLSNDDILSGIISCAGVIFTKKITPQHTATYGDDSTSVFEEIKNPPGKICIKKIDEKIDGCRFIHLLDRLK